MQMLILFFVGIVEMVIITAWTKAVSKSQILASGAITFVNIIIWYYILRIFVENITDIRLLFVYVIGCVIGTMLTTWYFQHGELKKK